MVGGGGVGGKESEPPLPLLRYLGCEGEGLGGSGGGGVTAGKRLPDKTVSTKENLYKTRLANKKNFFQSFLFRSVQNDKHHTNDNIEITFPQRGEGGAGAGCTTVSQLTGSVQWFFFFFCREGQGRGRGGATPLAHTKCTKKHGALYWPDTAPFPPGGRSAPSI